MPNNNYPNYASPINNLKNNNIPNPEKKIKSNYYINNNSKNCSKIPFLKNPNEKSNKKSPNKKNIKRPKSSKGALINVNNHFIPDFTYPRKYYEPKNEKSKSKSNSRKGSKSPKILFSEPSKGKCFACDVNCSISRSGNSPNKYVPYYGPLKKERKHITEYDGEKYGYYQYRPKQDEINNLEMIKK